VTPAQLGRPSLADLRIMRAEIEAMHGKRFEDEPWLQDYFNERYWYRPATKYDPSKLSAAERKNIALLLDQEKRQRGVRLAPGDLRAFQNRRINDAMLNGLGLYELRLLRNEIFAIRGQRFRTFWIHEHFEAQPWYQPRDEEGEVTLSATEEANLRVIMAREAKLHKSLSHKTVTPELIRGLFLEDARKLRNEIYARHGRMFKNRWLQDYFSSQSWYRPNPNFRESQLSRLETRNAVTILAYERKLQSEMDMTEG
jgi:YARHG domain